MKIWRILLCQMAIYINCHVVKANQCLGGQDIFALVRENSPTGEFIAKLTIAGEPGTNGIQLHLAGDNADWFFLDGKTIRLNTSSSRVLDREVEGSVLIAAVTCHKDETLQSEYRITVEVLNENDNKPVFLQQTIQPVFIAEGAGVNAVVCTVKAMDADGDTLMYIIDRSTADSSCFRIDLPTSGRVVLAKPLDNEIQSELQLIIFAVESNTKEKYNTSATITVHVIDDDDQLPQFQPCAILSQETIHPICTNPIYTVNITENEQNATLNFSPGPVHATDGDKGLKSPLIYAILSGNEDGRFHIDNASGEVMLFKPVENRLLTPFFKLRIMASQVNDPKKYTVATALIRVLARNQFSPQFNSSMYKGFVIEEAGAASLVYTYGNELLVIQAVDHDFSDGINPKIHYKLGPSSNNTDKYEITQGGLLIAKMNQLKASKQNLFQVLATDQESGEVVTTLVDVEVLQRGQKVPHGPFSQEWLYGLDMDKALVAGIAGILLLVSVAILCVLLMLIKQRKRKDDPVARGTVAQGKHPNVSLKWFQLVNSGQSIPVDDEYSCHNKVFSDQKPSSLTSCKHSTDPQRDNTSSIKMHNNQRDGACVYHNTLPVFVIPEPQTQMEGVSSLNMSNGRMSDRSSGKSVTFKDEVMLEEREKFPHFSSVEVQTEEVLWNSKTKAVKTAAPLKVKNMEAKGTYTGEDDYSIHQEEEYEEFEDDDEEEILENPYKSIHAVVDSEEASYLHKHDKKKVDKHPAEENQILTQ